MRNTLERAVIVCDSAVIEPRHLPPGFGAITAHSALSDANAIRVGVGTTVEDAEKQLILKTLESTHNNKTRAAEILGISLKTLHNKLKEYGAQGAAAEDAAADRAAKLEASSVSLEFASRSEVSAVQLASKTAVPSIAISQLRPQDALLKVFQQTVKDVQHELAA